MGGWSSMAARAGLVAVSAAVVAPACSLGSGTGSCSGTLNLPDCWQGPYDMHPDFFAAVPSSNGAMQIRIQHGGDNETFSDGLMILIDDYGEVRGDPTSSGASRPSLLGKSLVVTLPAGVTPPGVPVTPRPTPSIVHATLYLDATCRTQNDALYAVDSCTNTTSTLSCPGPSATAVDAGDGGSLIEAGPVMDGGVMGDGASSTDAGAQEGGDGGSGVPAIGQSTIVFNNLFDGNPNESDASKRLTDATFDFYLADPREICSGGLGPPPPCRGHLSGTFRFYFERGRPAQPFP
ncbi:MAG TPA: hypothetical protein VMI75_13950 [Polyangiaceae bacterium]|nr:hypothetical protein [Polyangiaceae bacterium]